MKKKNLYEYPVEVISLLQMVHDAGIIEYPCSPADLLRLKRRMEKNEELRKLITRAFRNSRALEKMSKKGREFILSQIAYRVHDCSSVYIPIFGTRAMGKSEVGQWLMLRISEIYRFMADKVVELAFSRDDAQTNSELSRATAENKTVVLLYDEKEESAGTGKRTEEESFINNLDTMRLLQHSVIRCSILLDWQFALRADFALEVIFKDKQHLINYCIVWIIDPDTKKMTPAYIAGIPLHQNDKLREVYESIKREEQQELTRNRGRRNRMSEVLSPIVDALVARAEERGIRVTQQRDWKTLKTLLEFEIHEPVEGGTLTTDEKESVCRYAIIRMQDKYGTGKEDDVKGYRPEIDRFEWCGSGFTWRAEVADLLKEHPFLSDYHPFFYAAEVEQLTPYRDDAQFQAITGRSKTQNYRWLKRMRKDKVLQGWIKEVRAQLHERFLAERFRAAGWHVIEKPRFEYKGQQYEEDLLIERDGKKIWLNAKCGTGLRTYVKKEYLTTWLLFNELHEEAYIVYLDLDSDRHFVYLPNDHVSVGRGENALDIDQAAFLYAVLNPVRDAETGMPDDEKCTLMKQSVEEIKEGEEK